MLHSRSLLFTCFIGGSECAECFNGKTHLLLPVALRKKDAPSCPFTDELPEVQSRRSLPRPHGSLGPPGAAHQAGPQRAPLVSPPRLDALSCRGLQ